MADVMRFSVGSATANLCVWGDGSATLGYLYSKRKGNGDATALLHWIIKHVEQVGLRVVYLEANPYGPKNSKALNLTQLIELYKAHGFVQAENDSTFMARITNKGDRND